MPKSKLQKLSKHAEQQGHKIDHELTKQLRESLSDTKINLRVPKKLKDEITAMAKKRNIPYQRFIKGLLIDAVLKEKAS